MTETKEHEQETERVSAHETVDRVETMLKEAQAPTRGPAADGDRNNPTPPEERSIADQADQPRSLLNQAAGSISAARTAITAHEESEKRLKSDPRYERDQKVYELGQTGKLGLVPPSEAEQAAQIARTGLPPEDQGEVPQTADEQVEEDMQRLAQAEKADASGTIKPGVQESDQDRSYNSDPNQQIASEDDPEAGAAERGDNGSRSGVLR